MIEQVDERYLVRGSLVLEQAESLLEEGLRLFEKQALPIDFSGVDEVDSSGLALLFEWERATRRRNQALRFVNLPASLKQLAELYGVIDIVNGLERS